MAISFVAAGGVATGTNPTASVPAGYARGDLLILVTIGTSTPATPAGWTRLTTLSSNNFPTIFYKFAASVEVSQQVTLGDSRARATMLAYRGVGAIETVPSFTTGTGTTATPNTLTTTYANDFVVNVYNDDNGTNYSFTPNASTTARVNATGSVFNRGLLITDELQVAAGISTARTATLSTSRPWAAVSFALIPSRTVYWVGGNGTWDASTRTNWANSSGGAGGVVSPSQNDAVIIDGNSGSPTVTLSGILSCSSLTTTEATCNLTSTGALTIAGAMTLSSTTTWSSTGTITFTATATITTNNVTLNSSIIVNGVSETITLGNDVTTTGTTTLTGGTLSLGAFTLTTGFFNSNSALTRVLAFGTSNITVNGAGGTLWDMTTVTGFTRTGTPTVNISNNSATATTIITGALAEANSLDFNYTTGTYTLTDASAVYDTLNFTGFSGTVSNQTRTIYGGFTIPASGVTLAAGALTTTFGNTSGTFDITTNGVTLDFPVTKTGIGGTVQLPSNLTLGPTRTFTFLSGTLALNNFTLTAGFFVSTGALARSITFGTTGVITVNGAGGTLFTTTSPLSSTGTSTVNINNNSAVATTVSSAATALNINYTTGTYTLTDTTTLYNNVDFTGFAGTVANGTRSVAGNWTNPASGVTFAAGALVTTFNVATITQTIINNGVTFDFPITKNGTGTLQLTENLTIGATRQFDLSQGTLTLNNFTLSTGTFASIGTSTRSINFGTTGALTCTGAGGTLYNTTASITFTGTSAVNINNNTALATTVTSGASVNINYTTGTYTLTDANAVYNNVNFTGFAGTVSNQVRSVNGNWTNPASGITWTAGTNTLSFTGTTGTQTVTTNNATFDFPVNKTAASTLVLGGSLTIGATRSFSVSAGTFTAGVYNITAGSFSLTAGTINMGSGTWTTPGTGTVWSVTGATINAETSTIVFSDNTTTAKTFAGGSKTYYNFQIGGANATATYTITGTNTFNIISSTKRVASTITIPVSVTTTVADWTVNGSNGNRIIVKTPTNGTAGTLASTTGIIAAIAPRYVSFQDIVFAGHSPSQRIRWCLGSTVAFISNVTGIYLRTDKTNQTCYALTTGTSFTVPDDWDSVNNIYLIGGGGGGCSSSAGETAGNKAGGGGGGGGGFTAVSNLSLTPGNTISYSIGAAGAIGGPSGSGGNTTFSIYSAGGGGGTFTNRNSGGIGGGSPGGDGGIGSTYNGGKGGITDQGRNRTNGGGGGGGAGGINGAGLPGAEGLQSGGVGGAGNNGGSKYINISEILYGVGGRGYAGGGAVGDPGTGFGGGGGGGGTGAASPSPGNGGAGTQGIIFIFYGQIEKLNIGSGITIGNGITIG